jgi:hypothetical protein
MELTDRRGGTVAKDVENGEDGEEVEVDGDEEDEEDEMILAGIGFLYRCESGKVCWLVVVSWFALSLSPWLTSTELVRLTKYSRARP